jgi:hypothetical protein
MANNPNISIQSIDAYNNKRGILKPGPSSTLSQHSSTTPNLKPEVIRTSALDPNYKILAPTITPSNYSSMNFIGAPGQPPTFKQLTTSQAISPIINQSMSNFNSN